jgi:hypothetical protein
MKVSRNELGRSGNGTKSPPAPDFGLALKAQGCPPTLPVDFPFFQIDELGVLASGHYTVMTMMMAFGSVPHALTLDFGPEMLERVLALASPPVRTVITKELARDGATPRRIALTTPIRCGLSATLGELQRTVRESFLPLVVRAVYPRPDDRMASGTTRRAPQGSGRQQKHQIAGKTGQTQRGRPRCPQAQPGVREGSLPLS